MIYIVEDDAGIRELVIYTLQNSGYRVCGFEQGYGLFSALSDPFPELILLDIMLPGEDGIKILKKLRQDERTKAIPIIMLTAKSAECDKVIGLDNGADDYVTKPFGMMELLSRIKAVLRRSTPQPESQILSYKNI
ncbi:response regulator, partial [Eubacterium aggregans]|uniref:response regulator n=1 Tax=Eubacterium aggregans TaxID=81409 RepID=UPI003F3E6B90